MELEIRLSSLSTLQPLLAGIRWSNRNNSLRLSVYWPNSRKSDIRWSYPNGCGVHILFAEHIGLSNSNAGSNRQNETRKVIIISKAVLDAVHVNGRAHLSIENFSLEFTGRYQTAGFMRTRTSLIALSQTLGSPDHIRVKIFAAPRRPPRSSLAISEQCRNPTCRIHGRRTLRSSSPSRQDERSSTSAINEEIRVNLPSST